MHQFHKEVGHNREMFLPRQIFLTKGVGKHREQLSSFELALRSAGIAACNLVPVSCPLWFAILGVYNSTFWNGADFMAIMASIAALKDTYVQLKTRAVTNHHKNGDNEHLNLTL